MPTFPMVHEQFNGLLSADGATSIKPSEWFTDKLQAKCKQTWVTFTILAMTKISYLNQNHDNGLSLRYNDK